MYAYWILSCIWLASIANKYGGSAKIWLRFRYGEATLEEIVQEREREREKEREKEKEKEREKERKLKRWRGVETELVYYILLYERSS